MKKIEYQLEGAKLATLGESTRTSEGKLMIILNASTPVETQERIKALGSLNVATIYIDGQHVNYCDFYKTLMN